MRIQKCYVWYCGISWFLWGAIIILTLIACAGYHVHHPALYRFLPNLSAPILLISLIPVHPILSVISLASSSLFDIFIHPYLKLICNIQNQFFSLFPAKARVGDGSSIYTLFGLLCAVFYIAFNHNTFDNYNLHIYHCMYNFRQYKLFPFA